MKRKVVIALIVAYAVTWVGGWIAHQREIAAESQAMYKLARLAERQSAARHQKEGLDAVSESDLNKNGPSARVKWCVPILPGVLLADSSYVIGPLWGKGGLKIVVYYGFGAKEIVTIRGWRA